ncbi:hypothetical protein RUND412_004403 [Rhizina undulata]
MSSNESAPERPSSPSESTPAPITFTVKSSNDVKYTVSFPPTTTVADLKAHLATLSEISADRQRLIYSGRVMKDEEPLATYKVQNGHTVHMVKGAASNAARSAGAGGSTSTAPPTAVPTNIAAGSGNNPLAGLTGARYAGHVQLPSAEMFGPDGGMGPPPSPESLIQAMSNPSVQATMNEMLQNPNLLDYIISSNPMLQQMGPEARQLMQSDMFREMMTNPDIIRQMSQMSAAMGGGRGLFGAPGGNPANSFPEPGRTDTTPAPQPAAGQSQNPPNPGASAGGIPGYDAANPFAALFGNPAAAAGAPAGQAGVPSVPPAFMNWMFPPGERPAGTPNPATNPTSPTSGPASSTPSQPPANPFFNPALAAALLGNPSAAGGANPNPFAAMFGGGGGFGAPTAPVDTRPPEERYADQLRQLNDMGFFDFDRNVEALRRSGGSVQGAVNHLLGG